MTLFKLIAFVRSSGSISSRRNRALFSKHHNKEPLKLTMSPDDPMCLLQSDFQLCSTDVTRPTKVATAWVVIALPSSFSLQAKFSRLQCRSIAFPALTQNRRPFLSRSGTDTFLPQVRFPLQHGPGQPATPQLSLNTPPAVRDILGDFTQKLPAWTPHM
jgi:hypothetical protein